MAASRVLVTILSELFVYTLFLPVLHIKHPNTVARKQRLPSRKDAKTPLVRFAALYRLPNVISLSFFYFESSPSGKEKRKTLLTAAAYATFYRTAH